MQALLTLSRMLNQNRIRPSDYRPILRQSLNDDNINVKMLAAERIGNFRFRSLTSILRTIINRVSLEQNPSNRRALAIMQRALASLLD